MITVGNLMKKIIISKDKIKIKLKKKVENFYQHII